MILLTIPATNRRGLVTSNPYTIDPALPGDTLVLTINVPNNDIVDPAKSFLLRIEQQDAVDGWVMHSELTFQCGPQHSPTSPSWEPPIVVSGVPASRVIRAVLDVPVRTNIGGTLELV